MPITFPSATKYGVAFLSLFAVPTLLAQQPAAHEDYLNPSLPIEQRAGDLVRRMTLSEKISQMQNEAPAIPRLHIAEYDWWNEGLHGVARSGYATVFPQAIGLAATWDTALIERVATTISTEARAKYNQALRENNHSIYYGLTIWSPNINIVRDPRWGRGQETYGEDPFLTGSIGYSFVRGLQGDDPTYFKTIATAKHFAVHSGPESSRHTFDAVISAHDLEDTYLPAFRRLVVDAHADSVMCAYNSIDGAPACASSMLLQQKLKRDWHFDGFIVSDCAAITDVSAGHNFAPDLVHGSAVSVHAGTDLSCGKEYAALLEAVQKHLIPESEINASIKRLFTARLRLGMFDPADSVPFNRIPFAENDSPAHAALSLQAARASMVLLKNNGTLPLSRGIRTLAVIGPNANTLPALEGNYNAVPSHPITPLAALEQRMPGHILYAQGSPYVEGVPIPVPVTLFSQSAAVPGLKAEYFNSPSPTTTPTLTRTDPDIDFDWNAASPVPGVSASQFSVRWTGLITPPITGDLHFDFSLAHCSTCGDAETVRVWLDNKLAYEYTHDATHGRHAPTTPFTLAFANTAAHPIRIEYTHDAPHYGAGLSFHWSPPADILRQQAVAVALKADAIVAFLGLSPEIEGEEMPLKVQGFEGGDRTAIELPAAQQQLVEALAATGKPVIIVLMNGSALALQNTEKLSSAILEAWYPGESGGSAIAETLFGDNNPSGRLPLTFYAATTQLPAFDDYSMANRTYRYFTGKPLYPFGWGLSYTTFAYSSGKLTTSLEAGKPLQASVELKNTGSRPGTETVEFYLIPKNKPGAPLRTLVAFEKVTLAPGATTTVHAEIAPRPLSLVDSAGIRSIQSGDYDLYIGGHQPTPNSGVTLAFQILGTVSIAP